MYRWSTVILSSGNDEYKLLIKRKALKDDSVVAVIPTAGGK